MTPPAPHSPPAPAGARSQDASRAARWLDFVTTAVLIAVTGTVIGAAAPSLLRASLGGAADATDFPPPVRLNNPTLVPQHHPGAHGFEIAPDNEDDVEEDEGPPVALGPAPRGNGPGARPRPVPADDDSGGALGIKSGITTRSLLLRDRRSGSIIHEVRAGESVSVLREEKDWALVLVTQEGDPRVVTGWARRSELLLR
jgi:hypothetical protein